ncbi:Oidioi.mRNA.OKI2018_I69.PAR.g12919.t1.cds [Oikopleura dioica]|uniref:Oidioi.mRNA.OKI2018_I69.PAR.g12919.t1.cds n=1 Tax=Oikopleura dioica TaxID=34765 RepID=A0ABN7S5R3_OIKDI|nr:Oidioi.mRNA.OKI2018_I69.PAR.g12919.t1.cds [Oikopleura dioica]
MDSSANDPAAQGYSYEADRPESYDDGEELSTEDIHRLLAAFIICVIATLAHKGDIFWTLMFFFSILLCGIWWASDKTDNLYQSFTKKPTLSQRYQFHDEF